GIGVVVGDREVVHVRLARYSMHPLYDAVTLAVERHHPLAWLEVARRDPATVDGEPGMVGGGMDRLAGGSTSCMSISVTVVFAGGVAMLAMGCGTASLRLLRGGGGR